MFDKLDTNKDGKIDSLELSAGVSKDGKTQDVSALMTQVDTDSDGAISESENETFLAAMDEAQKSGNAGAAGTKPSGPPPGGPPPSGGGSSSSSATEVFDKLDTNKDGKVSVEELMAAAAEKDKATSSTTSEDEVKSLFKAMDENGDGSISKDETTSFMAKLEEARKAKEQDASTYNQQGQANYDAVGTSVNTIA